jgi:glycosyltransferase involved in cell wall biosynthesis
MMNPRPVILLGKRPAASLEDEIRAGRHPRVEYLELARRLDAEIIDYAAIDVCGFSSVRWLARRMGNRWGLALLSALRRSEFSDIYATGEDVGLPLGLMLLGCRWNGCLTVVVHNADTRKRRLLFRLLHRAFTRVICIGSAQQHILTCEIGVPSEKVLFLPYWLDHAFYRPERSQLGDYALSVGMEGRDYPTLCAAAAGSRRHFHIVGSGFSPGAGFSPASGAEPSANVTLGTGYSSTELRDLYARARLIIVPLRSLTYAAGVTAVVEGMAMGKAVIVSDSPGISDYVKDGVSGRVVPAGDVRALRSAIDELWDDPVRLKAMGRNNRERIEREINTDCYVDKISRVMGYVSVDPHAGECAYEV